MKFLPLALAALSGTAKSRMVSVRAKARLYSVVIGCAGISATFLLVAATIALAAEIGAIAACLAMAGVFALVSVVGLLRLNAHQRRRNALKSEQLLIASSASTPIGASVAMSVMAFLRGFMNPR